MNEPDYIHSMEMVVRDYECDMQGIVNNANYLHYLEHARHDYLISKGVDFVELHNEGTDLVVVRIEIDYKASLKSRDKFVVKSFIRREGNVRISFFQDIFRISDEKMMVRAKVTTTAIKNGRPFYPDEVIGNILDH